MKPSQEARGAALGGGAVGYVADEVEREEAAEVEEDGGLGVEELQVVVAHGVFEGAEVWEEVVEEEAARRRRSRLGCRGGRSCRWCRSGGGRWLRRGR